MAAPWSPKCVLLSIILTACVITLITNLLVLPGYKSSVLYGAPRDEGFRLKSSKPERLKRSKPEKPRSPRCRKKCRKTCPGRACICKTEPMFHVMCRSLGGSSNVTKKHKLERLRTAKDNKMKTSSRVSFAQLDSCFVSEKCMQSKIHHGNTSRRRFVMNSAPTALQSLPLIHNHYHKDRAATDRSNPEATASCSHGKLGPLSRQKMPRDNQRRRDGFRDCQNEVHCRRQLSRYPMQP